MAVIDVYKCQWLKVNLVNGLMIIATKNFSLFVRRNNLAKALSLNKLKFDQCH